MKLADVSIRRPVLATVMVGALTIFGIVAYPRIGVDLFPEIEFPVVTVTAIYPGADPGTVESKVVDKLEEAINTVSGIKVLRSTSMENVGLVIIQFELERKVDQALQDVRDKVAGVLRDLPKDLEPPVIEKIDVGATPVLYLAVAGQKDVRDLTHLADKVVKEKLQTLPGVGAIEIVGGQKREFHVYIDPRKLESYHLSVTEVMQALGAQNVEIPGGRLDVGAREFAVKTRGQVHTAREIGEIIITAAAGAPVRVSDVARVEDGRVEKRSHSSLNGKSAVALVVSKQSGANTVEVAHSLRDALEKLKSQIPKDVTISVPTDNSIFIENSIEDVKFDLLFGAALAIVVIMFFLHNWRATFISSLALPASVVATFAFIQAMGFTFNFMTMLALSLSIGILIDDAIVVIENIHRHLEMGKPPLRAATEACQEIGLAVMATTASIVAVFLPVATMKGIIGRFFLQFGLTVTFAVSVSLFVAFTLTPMLAARMLKPHEKKEFFLARWIEAFLKALDRGYRRVLGWSLRHRLTTLALATAAMASAMFIVRYVPVEFLPMEDRSQFNVKLELPTGTALAKTEAAMEEVAAKLRQIPGVDATFGTLGSGKLGEVNMAEIQVNLVPRKGRAFNQEEAMHFARALFAGRTDAQFAVEPVPMFSSGGAFRQSMLQFNIRGRDYSELNRAAEQIQAEMKKLGGYVDLDTSYRGGKPEVGIQIDRDRAADLGIPIASLAMTIRLMIAGEKATDITADGERHDVRVRLDEKFRQKPEDLYRLEVRSTHMGPMGMPPSLVRLSNLVNIDTGSGPAKIERQNRRRQVTVFANLQGKVLGQAVAEVDSAARSLPSHLDTSWTGMGDIMRESFGHLITALILAIVMVYLILAAQFESFLHPFTIMLSLPLSFVGALGALALTGQTISIFSMIGIILLMGLVTKNAILLVDYTNTLRDRGLDRMQALLEAGPVRLRPILMTTAAMIFGMVPVAMAWSEGGEQRAPMAIAVIGGLITSTLLTLVVVPVVYSLLDALIERVTGKKRRARGAGDEVETTVTEGAAKHGGAEG
jgi:HAE1 family hydrophobic/amphiphilic exporter-1